TIPGTGPKEQAAAAARPRTAVVDMWVDVPENRDRSQFLDFNHYRAPRARALEAEAAAALAKLRSGRQ
ncbi:MAG: hypothetical protein ACRCTI_01150, partial [Beijerinckiaceae bacterium]